MKTISFIIAFIWFACWILPKDVFTSLLKPLMPKNDKSIIDWWAKKLVTLFWVVVVCWIISLIF